MKKTQRQRGFSLIELSLVLGLSVMIASGLVGMFNAHLQMMKQAAQYQFLAEDAPFIGLLLTRTIGNAEDYRIYASRTAAESPTGTPVLSGPAVKLWMAQPNGISLAQPNATSYRQAILSFETINGHNGIYFFLADPNTGAFPATPNWELAGSQVTAAAFNANANSNPTTGILPGVLLITLTGSNNDQYMFAAEKK
jgi:prepilin-type N-terminal cleavage/methylation domain-containing protein